jgi:hypothetical protein
LTLLPHRESPRALVVGDAWGRLAVPLSRRAIVTALLPSAPLAALLACVAAQEGAPLAACAGTLAAPPFADGRFDLVLLHDGLDAAPDMLPGAAALLTADGICYATARNRLAAGAFASSTQPRSLRELRQRIADAGLVPLQEYACFPDAARPRAVVPLPLLAAHLRGRPDGAADLARTGLSRALRARLRLRPATRGVARPPWPSVVKFSDVSTWACGHIDCGERTIERVR